LRILLITQWWEPDEGPPQWRLRRFTDAMLRRGHRVEIVTSPPHFPHGTLTSNDPHHFAGATDRREAGVTVHRTRFREHSDALPSRIADQLVVFVSSIWIGRSLARVGGRVDVVMTSVPALPSAFAALIVSRLHHAPLVLDLRDAWPDLVDHVAPSYAKDERPRFAVRVKGHVARPLFRAAGAAFTAVLRRAGLVTTTSEWLATELTEKQISLCSH
jgi:hypothetical protein